MIFDVNNYMEKTKIEKTIMLKNGTKYTYQELRPKIKLNNGISLSIQGSKNHYCSPRYNHSYYSSVEVGYMSSTETPEFKEFEDKFNRYQDGQGSWVFGYVPVDELEQYINSVGVKPYNQGTDYTQEEGGD
jgi:hypothetical protein